MKRSLITKYLGGLGLSLTLGVTGLSAAETGAVYTMDNAAAANHVLVFQRQENGQLTAAGSYDTGGAGTGAGLSSQGSVVLSRSGRWLFVCNTGSGEISVFAVSRAGLTLTDKVSSGGKKPVSLALRHNLLYALNAGGGVGDKDNITGFIFANGQLVALPDSTRTLSADSTTPGQISFTRSGENLVVTEQSTSLIDIFAVQEDGLTGERKPFQSAGMTPFGFDVGRQDRLFVSEAAGGAPNASSASSYSLSDEGDLALISGAVPTKQTAACWLILSRDGRFVYTANAGSGSLSGFRVSPDGSLELLDADGRTAVIGNGSHPVDMVQSRNGRFLYSLANGDGTLHAFHVETDGSLQPLAVLSGIPTSAAGLAGR